MDEVKEREKVKVHPINIERQISPLKDLVSLIKLYSYFRKEKPHIIHSITPKAGLLCMIAGKLAGVPVRIHTYTGLVFPSKSGVMQKILILMDKILCYSATYVYPEGLGVKLDLLNHKITSKPLKIIANGNVNGINTHYFSPNQISETEKQNLKNQLQISEKDFIFIFVGRLVKDKGINELVAAFTALQDSVSNLNQSTAEIFHPLGTGEENFRRDSATKIQNPKLLLVGTLEQHLDPLSPETLEEIQKNPDIISVGFQHDVRPYFAISEVLVFPSYREGFPNVVMQAGAMELPAIVTDINGCNEIIENGKNGIIIPVKNSLKIQEAMQTLMENKELYSQLKSNARSEITSRFEQEFVWQKILEEYESAVCNVR